MHHTLNASVPQHIYGYVAKEILHGLDPEKVGAFEPCAIFGVTSMARRSRPSQSSRDSDHKGRRVMAAKRGRRPGFVMSDEHRTKIANSQILKALIEHVEGVREMSASQVSAGLGLLRKVMPDLSAIEHSGEIEHRSANEMTDDQLAAIAAGRSAGIAPPTRGPSVTH